MSGGNRGGARGAMGTVPVFARKLVQGIKKIVDRQDAEIYAALRECDMDPNEAISRLLSQETFRKVKSKRDKKKEVKEIPEPRSRGASKSNGRSIRGDADRSGRSSSHQFGSSGADYMAPKSSILRPVVSATNSSHKQTIPSVCANKDVVPNASIGMQQSSSGFQHNWCGVPGQMSMADVVKMGRPQVRSSGKPMAASDASYTGQSPYLSGTVNQNSKQSASTALPTTFDQRFPALQDHIPQIVNSSHAFAGNHQTHENDWFSWDEPPPRTESTGIETIGDTSLSAPSLGPPMFVATTTAQENSHVDENSSTVAKSEVPSKKHLEIF